MSRQDPVRSVEVGAARSKGVEAGSGVGCGGVWIVVAEVRCGEWASAGAGEAVCTVAGSAAVAANVGRRSAGTVGVCGAWRRSAGTAILGSPLAASSLLCVVTYRLMSEPASFSAR